MRHCADCFHNTHCSREDFCADNCAFYIDKNSLLSYLVGRSASWIYDGEFEGLISYVCSDCGARVYVREVENMHRKKFCENCGAHMGFKYLNVKKRY